MQHKVKHYEIRVLYHGTICWSLGYVRSNLVQRFVLLWIFKDIWTIQNFYFKILIKIHNKNFEQKIFLINLISLHINFNLIRWILILVMNWIFDFRILIKKFTNFTSRSKFWNSILKILHKNRRKKKRKI